MTARAALWGLCTWKKKQHFHQFYILTCIHFVSDDSSWPWLHLRGRGDTVGEVSVTIKQWMPADSDGLWSDTGQFESHKFLWKKKNKSNLPFYSMQHEREFLSKYPGGGWRTPPFCDRKLSLRSPAGLSNIVEPFLTSGDLSQRTRVTPNVSFSQPILAWAALTSWFFFCRAWWVCTSHISFSPKRRLSALDCPRFHQMVGVSCNIEHTTLEGRQVVRLYR